MDIANLITTLGFPIACCCVLGWYIYRLQEMHKQETDALRETIDNNTKILERLLIKMNQEELIAEEKIT